MTKKLNFRQSLVIASMLFGLFFGAGNLIFPVSTGQLAGADVWQASAGFLLTGVGLPILGVAALGISRENGLLELSSRIGKGYGMFFTCALYLTIGPFFAIPRCATVSFTIGPGTVLSPQSQTLALGIFSFVFFAVALFLALRPGEILTWVGKVLTPSIPGAAGGAGAAGPDGSHGRNQRDRASGRLCFRRVFQGLPGGV